MEIWIYEGIKSIDHFLFDSSDGQVFVPEIGDVIDVETDAGRRSVIVTDKRCSFETRTYDGPDPNQFREETRTESVVEIQVDPKSSVKLFQGWLEEAAPEKYAGKWLAIFEGRLIAEDSEYSKLRKKAQKRAKSDLVPFDRIFLFRYPG